MHNLAWRLQDLKDHFREAGEVVRAEIFTEGPGGRSKGCGIVEMASVDDAANAVEKLMDSELQGRRILVREDRESRTATIVEMIVENLRIAKMMLKTTSRSRKCCDESGLSERVANPHVVG